jgi:tRNA1(Val) A37 N6-methylase TrmN6
MQYLYEKYGNIEVASLPELEGGGTSYGQKFIPLVRKLYGKVERVYEFCSGPGYIGFSLLANGLCSSLCLSDINPAAVEAVRDTIRRNMLEDTVSVYLSDGLREIPENERWDLVISNPPHFNPPSRHRALLANDIDWAIHEHFFLNVHKYLKPHGSILLIENYLGSEETYFLKYMEDGGLEFLGSCMVRNDLAEAVDTHYFLWARKKDGEILFRVDPILVFIDVSDSSETLWLKAGQKYQVELFSGSERQLDIQFSLSDGRGGRIILFKNIIVSLSEGRPRRIPMFYLNKGEYYLDDLRTNTHLKTINVID